MASGIGDTDTYIANLLGNDATLITLAANAWASLQSPQVIPAPATPPGPFVWGEIATEQTEYPIVVFMLHAGPDVLGLGGARIMTRSLYQVKCIGTGNSFATITPMMDRVDALLQAGGVGVVQGSTIIIGSVREQQIKKVELIYNVRYNVLGGMYRIDTQPAF